MAEVVLSPAEDAEKLVPSSFTQPGTVFINPSARAAQRRLALAIVVIPSLGVIAAAASWFVGHGPSALDIALFSGLFVDDARCRSGVSSLFLARGVQSKADIAMDFGRSRIDGGAGAGRILGGDASSSPCV